MYVPDLTRVETDAALGNSPLWFGEWSIATNFIATDDFLNKWADAQKLMYSKSAGWIVSLPRRIKPKVTDADCRLLSFGTSNSRIPRLQLHGRGNGKGTLLSFIGPKLIPRHHRSYFKGVELGYLTEDPAAYHDPDVCAPYINSTEAA